MMFNKILIATTLLIVIFCGCKKDEYFSPKEIRVSDCNLSSDDFIKILCEDNKIDINDYYRIECPKCPSGHYVSWDIEKPKGGAFIERTPDGEEFYLFYGVAEGIEGKPAGIYCDRCGYQIGSNWTIFKIDPNNFYYDIFSPNGLTITDINQLDKYKVYRRTR